MSHKSHPFGWILAASITVMALPSQGTAQEANQGFIYGRVTTESGSEYQGFLRWGTQEAFWDDLFHSVKEDLPYRDYLDEEELDRIEGRNTRFSIFNWDFSISGPSVSDRQFIARFGDIASMEVHRGSWVDVTMRNGSTYEVSGGSDDVSDDIHVKDASLGEIDLRWNRIESIRFMSAPASADPGVQRLYGTVEAREGDFTGYIQWDEDECQTTDLLDGDTEDGDVSIEMGKIQSIERMSSRRSRVTLKDGRELRLDGSNDVDESNRGIMIEDPRFGRVTVEWGSFDRLTFADPPGSGPGFGDFPGLGELSGTVTDADGGQHSGRLVLDLDEAEGWEMLNGYEGGVHYDLPLYRVASIEPHRRGSRIALKNGETLDLEGSADVSEDNLGVLVFEGSDPVYIPWEEVERIEFDR